MEIIAALCAAAGRLTGDGRRRVSFLRPASPGAKRLTRLPYSILIPKLIGIVAEGLTQLMQGFIFQRYTMRLAQSYLT